MRHAAPICLLSRAFISPFQTRRMASTKLAQSTHLILDYDGTLTCKDTMALLGTLSKQSKLTWQQIVDAYLRDYETYKRADFPWRTHGPAEYSQWLASRKWVEQKSAQRVEDAAFFRNVTQDDLNCAVSKCLNDWSLQLRSGWLELLDLFLSHYDSSNGSFADSKVSILSVNWSEKAIRRTLHEAAKDSQHPCVDKLCRFIYDIEVNANEIEGLDSPYGSSGRVCRGPLLDIRTSDDKLRFFPDCKEALNRESPLLVYVGDSSTDFDCLCAADLGVWLCDVAEFEYRQRAEETFKPLNYVPPPLSSITTPQEARELFYWAPTLEEIRKFLCSR